MINLHTLHVLKGGITWCGTCHDFHSSNQDGLVRSGLYDEEECWQWVQFTRREKSGGD